MTGRLPSVRLSLPALTAGFFLLSLVTLIAALPQQDSSAGLVIRGATLVDGRGGSPLPDSAILIRGDRIESIGPSADFEPPEGVEILDATGKVVIPGLIDGHIHFREYVGELFLAHGVTSVVDLGNVTEWVVAVRDATEAGKIRGPRLFTSGVFVDGGEDSDAYRNFATRVKRSGRHKVYVDSVREAREVTRGLIEAGVDTIKVYQNLTPEQLKAVVEEAHDAGLAVVGHSDDVHASVKAGIDGITHLWGISASALPPAKRQSFFEDRVASPYAHTDDGLVDELIELLVTNDVYVNPLLEHEHKAFTEWARQHEQEDFELLNDPGLSYVPLDAKLGMLSMYHRVRNYADRFGEGFPRLEYLSKEDREEFRRGYLKAKEFVRKFVARGGKIFLGTDSGGGAKEVAGIAVLQEMEVLSTAGMTPMQILVAATRNNAELFRIADRVGTLEAGKLADLVLLDADPLADISNVRRINRVMKGGQWQDLGFHSDFSLLISDPTAMHLESSSYYPRPFLYDLSPRMTVRDNPERVTIRLNGTGFIRGSVVRFNGHRIPTRFISRGRLEATIPASFFGQVGTYPVDVVNPAPGGGASGSYGFIVNLK